ncbi:MAG: DUF2236 domain-containing protein [Sphingomonadales bacterium]|nr:MAG: DUF2236 domain-containing protein [Sphingomonadales bacterium]
MPAFAPLPDLLASLHNIGDPLADAAIAEAARLGVEGARLLDRAVREGPSPETQPAAAALAADVRSADWADASRMARGSDAYLAIGASWIGLALGPGSLAHTYSAPSIARVLVRTGNLTKMARHRILETGAWNVATVLPEGLTPGRDGFVQNLQVRLLHARVRHALLAKGWDVAAQGMPINQIELARTWLDFTYIPFEALATLGITFSADEIEDLYHLWQVAGHLLGIDPRLYRPVTNQAEGARLLSAIDANQPPPGADSQLLTAAMLEAMGQLLAPELRVSEGMATELSRAVLRRLHGDAQADALGVPRSWTRLLLPAIAIANRVKRARERRDPALRAASIARTIATFQAGEGLLPGGTAYTRAAAESPGDALPVSG